MGLKHFLAETGPNLTDRLIFLRLTVVTSKEERPVNIRSFAFPIVPADDDQVK